MDFWDAAEARCSVRSFESGEVSPDQVERILHAATRAPSAGNGQPWHFYVVWSERLRADLADAAHGQGFVAEAPVVIVVCADTARAGERYGRRGRELYCLQDTAAATTMLLLAATALGLGGCWVGSIDEEDVAQVLSLPAPMRPIALVPIGVPSPEEESPPRRSVSEVSTQLT